YGQRLTLTGGHDQWGCGIVHANSLPNCGYLFWRHTTSRWLGGARPAGRASPHGRFVPGTGLCTGCRGCDGTPVPGSAWVPSRPVPAHTGLRRTVRRRRRPSRSGIGRSRCESAVTARRRVPDRLAWVRMYPSSLQSPIVLVLSETGLAESLRHAERNTPWLDPARTG